MDNVQMNSEGSASLAINNYILIDMPLKNCHRERKNNKPCEDLGRLPLLWDDFLY